MPFFAIETGSVEAVDKVAFLHVIAEARIAKRGGQFVADLETLRAYAGTETDFHAVRIRAHADKLIDSVAYDAAQSSFPTGMSGGDGMNIGGIKQHRDAVSGAYSYAHTWEAGDECVGVRKFHFRINDLGHIERMRLDRSHDFNTVYNSCFAWARREPAEARTPVKFKSRLQHYVESLLFLAAD